MDYAPSNLQSNSSRHQYFKWILVYSVFGLYPAFSKMI